MEDIKKPYYSRSKEYICDFCNRNYILCKCDLPYVELQSEYHENELVFLDQQ